jgi:hypothetical protein
MGLMPIYQVPNIRKPAKGHKTDPYLLRGCGVRVARQVRSGAPDIMNTDQGRMRLA